MSFHVGFVLFYFFIEDIIIFYHNKIILDFKKLLTQHCTC